MGFDVISARFSHYALSRRKMGFSSEELDFLYFLSPSGHSLSMPRYLD